MPLLLLLVFFHRLHFIICSLLIFYVSSGEARSVQRSHLRVPFALSDVRSSRGCWQGLLVGSTENSWQVHTAPGFHQTSLLEHDGIFHTYLFVGPLTLWTDAVHKRIQPLARTSQGFLLSLPPHLQDFALRVSHFATQLSALQLMALLLLIRSSCKDICIKKRQTMHHCLCKKGPRMLIGSCVTVVWCSICVCTVASFKILSTWPALPAILKTTLQGKQKSGVLVLELQGDTAPQRDKVIHLLSLWASVVPQLPLQCFFPSHYAASPPIP